MDTNSSEPQPNPSTSHEAERGGHPASTSTQTASYTAQMQRPSQRQRTTAEILALKRMISQSGRQCPAPTHLFAVPSSQPSEPSGSTTSAQSVIEPSSRITTEPAQPASGNVSQPSSNDASQPSSSNASQPIPSIPPAPPAQPHPSDDTTRHRNKNMKTKKRRTMKELELEAEENALSRPVQKQYLVRVLQFTWRR